MDDMDAEEEREDDVEAEAEYCVETHLVGAVPPGGTVTLLASDGWYAISVASSSLSDSDGDGRIYVSVLWRRAPSAAEGRTT